MKKEITLGELAKLDGAEFGRAAAKGAQRIQEEFGALGAALKVLALATQPASLLQEMAGPEQPRLDPGPDRELAPETGGSQPQRPRRWTPELLQELDTHREKHGTKAAAEHFKISHARVRALLPRRICAPNGYSAFNPHQK